MGKGDLANGFEINDSLAYGINSLYVQDPETGNSVPYYRFTEPLKTNLTTLMEHLVEKYSSYKNIKIYYTDTMPAMSGSNLMDEDLIWEVGSVPTGETEILSGSFDYPEESLRNNYQNLKLDLTLGTTLSSGSLDWSGDPVKYPGVKLKISTSPASLSISSTDPWTLAHGHSGFTVKAEGLARQKYLVSTYEVETDWAKVHAEASKILGSISYSGYLKNKVDDGLGADASSKGNSIYIEDAVVTKSVDGSAPTQGTANWRITASTGDQKQDELKLEDHLSVSVGDDGKTLNVEIKNLPGDEVLAEKQTYIVTYGTAFDKDAFIKNGGKLDDQYTLENSVTMHYGELNRSHSQKRNFNPKVPVEIGKHADGCRES